MNFRENFNKAKIIEKLDFSSNLEGVDQYLVQFKDGDRLWIPIENFDSLELIIEYWTRNEAQHKN